MSNNQQFSEFPRAKVLRNTIAVMDYYDVDTVLKNEILPLLNKSILYRTSNRSSSIVWKYSIMDFSDDLVDKVTSRLVNLGYIVRDINDHNDEWKDYDYRFLEISWEILTSR